MLYVTTRNQIDVFTAKHTLEHARAEDGGMYYPFRMAAFSQEEIRQLKTISFNQCIADMLNLMFGVKLSSWDVDFCIGRYPVRIQELGSRIVMAETWHNPDWDFSSMVKKLTRQIGAQTPDGWPEIAVRVAVLFGIYGELLRQDLIQPGELMDVSVLSGDMTVPVSAWYARQWGLPIGSIVCCCNENNMLWNLICHGQMHTDTLSIKTFLPEADVSLPAELERLICACGGTMELESYLECCRTGRLYVPDDVTLSKLRKGLFVSVVSSHRILQTIPNAYSTHGYLAAPGTALAYAGLLDYRAKKGKLRCSVVLADKSPVCDSSVVAKVMDLDEKKLKDLM